MTKARYIIFTINFKNYNYKLKLYNKNYQETIITYKNFISLVVLEFAD